MAEEPDVVLGHRAAPRDRGRRRRAEPRRQRGRCRGRGRLRARGRLSGGGNLGGGGFMTVQLADGRKTFLDFREKAPLAATADMYLDAAGNVVKGSTTDGHLRGRRAGHGVGPRDRAARNTAR